MTNKQKQWQLYFLDYYHLVIDGDFGPASVAATEAFQRAHGLDPDGIFGPITEAKSIEVVKQIQEAVGAVPDGLAGPNTVAATITFQRAHGLDPDGIAGPLTRAKIAEEEAGFWDGVKYFDRDEFRCNCGGRYCDGFPAEPNPQLVKVAERVREYFGAPVIISSGVRCQTHNGVVGGVPNSRHTMGKAMDFRVVGKTATEVLLYLKRQPELDYSYCIDSNYVHMDVE